MEFRLKPAPYVKGRRSTCGIMLEFFAVLCVVWIYSIVFNFLKYGSTNGVSAILIGVVSIVCSILVDLIVALFKKVKFKELGSEILHSYSFVTGLILALCVPANTKLYAVGVAAVFATTIGKLVFGGFGHNIVNPAGIGRIFITNFAAGTLGSTAASVIDGTAGATITSNIHWALEEGTFMPAGFTLKDLFLGNYAGALGETCTLLLLVVAIYMIVRNIIDYRLTISYLLTVFICTIFVGLMLGTNPFTYSLVHLCTGGLMFGAVFMATDPVTTPSSPLGKIIYGVGCGMLTTLFRVCGSMPEGVVFSLVIMNLFVPLIDTSIKGNSKTKIWKKWIVVAAALIIAVLVNIGLLALKLA